MNNPRYGRGGPAVMGEFPWVGALLNSENNMYIGGVVLIAPKRALTVAHKM